MKFSALFAAVAGFAGVASAQSTTSRPASGASAGSSVTSRPASSAGSGASAMTSPKPTSSASLDPNLACLGLVQRIPQCGFSLLVNEGSSKYSCQLTDLACQCSNSRGIQSGIYDRVLSGCGPTTALDLQSAAAELCACVSAGGKTDADKTITQTTVGLNPSANKLCVSYGLAIPTCGTTALQSIASSKYGCGDFDFQCQCAHFTEVQAVASTPVIDACGTTVALKVESAADQLCSCVTANNAFLVSQAQANGSLPKSTSVQQAAAPTNAPVVLALPFVPVGGLAGFFSIFAGFLAWL